MNLRTAVLGGTSLIAFSWFTPALAQGAQPSGPADSAGVALAQEIVVTASRVARAGFSAPTPTTVVGLEDIQRIGATNVARVLNELPAFRGTSTNSTGTLSANTGGNYLDLRGMGITRTLVLVDGQRHVPSNITGQVDLNLIPSILLERTEIVTGGASAAYGSDAVAGVVNIITRKKFSGLEANAQYGVSSRGDNRETNLAAILGTAFHGGRGHITVAGQYVDHLGVGSVTTRSWGRSAPQLIPNPLFAPGNGQPTRIIALNVRPSAATNGGLINSPGVLRGTQFGPGGVPSAFVYGNPVGPTWMIGGSGSSLADYQQLTTPNERAAISTALNYQITPKIEANATFSWSNSKRKSISGVTFEPNITVRADNAYLPASIKTIMAQNNLSSFTIGRIGKDYSTDHDQSYFIHDTDNTVYRGVLSLNGALGGNWKWNAYYEHGDTDYTYYIHNQRIEANWSRAIDAVINPATGAIVCRSTLTSPGDGCVPFNMFGQFSASPAAQQYITGSVYSHLKFREDVVSGTIQGEPFSTWAGPVSIAAGGEYRADRAKINVDPISQASGFYSGNPKPISGNYEVKEVFAETVVPLAKDIPLANLLELNAAIRYTDYNVSGGVTSWKVGLSYKPIEELRFRFTRSRDIRAPNVNELYTPGTNVIMQLIDPTNNSQGNVLITATGSSGLTPETADTTTLGLVYQPTWAPRLRASVDAYEIKVKNVITTLGAQDTVNRCVAGTADLCRLVIRNNSGIISNVFTPFLNLASLETSGIDFEVGYVIPLKGIGPLDGNLNLRWLATYVDHLRTNDGRTVVDVAGETGGAHVGGVPHWSQTIVASFNQGPLTLSGQLRYVGPGTYDSTATPATLDNNRIPSRVYTKLGVNYALARTKFSRNLQLYATVDNLFDVPPPIAPNATQSFTNAALFDAVGRTFQIGARFTY